MDHLSGLPRVHWGDWKMLKSPVGFPSKEKLAITMDLHQMKNMAICLRYCEKNSELKLWMLLVGAPNPAIEVFQDVVLGKVFAKPVLFKKKDLIVLGAFHLMGELVRLCFKQSRWDSQFVKVAVCASTSDLITRLAGFPNVRKEGISLAGKVIQLVLKLLNEDSSEAVLVSSVFNSLHNLNGS
ncbi:hypothetical protein SADUNF_Sadunf10G0185300 [Salix dunnii]|uniref:Pre-rRNA-processing protein RIX1 N-terminal domain-containing protein n=1 Tax=Salix dunnii TaxID=1413687 RepID=A0A835MQB1_9ROSI|nr:hypothetical protein SADUNF_Sadunf10G0185300 [Salix dunnii]